ncbi:MAG: hypothetical protein RL213_1421 [Bacteroidota bacterium]
METAGITAAHYGSKAWPATVAYGFLLFVWCSTFRVFATLPLQEVHQFLSVAGILFYTLYYAASLYLKSRRASFNRLDLLLAAFIGINFFSSFRALSVFGQPLYYGLMAQRSVLLGLSGALIVSLLDQGKITLRQLEVSFLFLAVVLLLASFGFVLFAKPSRFVDEEFVVYSPLRGYRFRFQFIPVIMLLFYSLFRRFSLRRPLYLLLFLSIIFYLVFFLQSRTTLAVLFMTLCIYFFRHYSFGRRLKLVAYAVTAVISLVLIAYALDVTSLLERYSRLFGNAASVFRGVAPDEASSAIRYLELKTAFSRIGLHPWLGNGFISSQWNGGWHRLLGYFYPVDIGIFGNLVVFGAVGTFVIYSPYFYAFRLSQKTVADTVFLRTCNYTLLFLFLTMFFSAVNIRDSSAMLFLVALSYYHRYRLIKPREEYVHALS